MPPIGSVRPEVRLMTLNNEFTRECLAIRVARRVNSLCVLETRANVMLVRGIPKYIRSDNCPEMTAKILRQWLGSVGSKTPYIELGTAPGRTATGKAPTASCGTNCSKAKSSAASRKHRYSLGNGVTTTTPSGPIHCWGIDRQRRRLLCPCHPIWIGHRQCSSHNHFGRKYPAG
jgi:hypothetical protein